MINFQYDALEASVKLEDITSSSHNTAILHRLKNNDPALSFLFIDELFDHYDDNDDLFEVREGDDLGWLGYFIGGNETLTSLSVYQLPEDREQAEMFFTGIQLNKSIGDFDISSGVLLGEGFSAMNLPHVTSMSLDCHLEREYAHYFAIGLRRCESLEDYSGQWPVTAEIVESLTTLPMLENVGVWKNRGLAISPDECVALRELLLNANRLNHLDLSGVGLGNDGLRLLAEGLACYYSLADGVLDLSSNDIGDEGLHALLRL